MVAAGTSFIAATESAAPDAYREILIESGGDDIVLTSEVTGIPSNMLRLSLERRSEEHTSELQSLMRISYAVFCLKKKNNTTHIHTLTQLTLTNTPNSIRTLTST